MDIGSRRRKSAQRRPLRCGACGSGSSHPAAGRSCGRCSSAGCRSWCVVVDRPCGAIEIATDAGVAVELVERTTFGPDFDRVAYTHDVIDALQRHDVDLVAIAGFGTILSKPFVDAFGGRAVNTHPVAAARVQGLARGARRARARGEGHGLHRAPRHRRGRRRADPRPGGRAGARRRHRGDVARTHQGGRAHALPRRHREARDARQR